MTQQQPNDLSDGRPPIPVVVIGAGMAGLVAARELHRQGTEVLVLEAASRPGGRVLAETTALGSRVDLGGQWIGHGHHRFERLAAELGTTVFAMHTPKRPTIAEGVATVRNSGLTAAAANATLAYWEVVARLGAPRSWKQQSVRSWLRRVPNRRARRLLEVLVSISTTADLERYSMHAFLDMVRFQGGLSTMLATAGGAQERLVTEAAGTLVERLAAGLDGKIVYDSAVTALHRDDTGVTIHSASGVHRATEVIMTVPPPVAATIEHHPPLPADRIRLQDNTYMGSVYKAIAVYPDPFWREYGHAELMLLTEPGMAVFDTSPPDGPGHLCVLVAGPEARALDSLGLDTRRATILNALAEQLGPAVFEPRDWHEKAWHQDRHVGGGYSALPTIGYEEGYYPASAQPTGHIHWAGTETAHEHAGYIEGAIESGERAAREVLDARTLLRR
ncbi:flavin monoamine oxidase family protein [Nocardia inohanensis]|uniref:flavin monoamine oxidase family protein n=1 Tax=Nocardia inohanensis TaxID=209246 RepID=UPI000831BA46|nr:FAD-dependent oxidoreductase [Nocardia inohanensis]